MPDSGRNIAACSVSEIMSGSLGESTVGVRRPLLIDLDKATMVGSSLEELVATIGPGKRKVRIYGEDRMSQPREKWETYCEFEDIEPEVYAAWLDNGEAKRRHAYMAQVDLKGTRIDADLGNWIGDVCRKLFPGPLSEMNLWLGPGGHREPLHFDPADGLLVQLFGQKRVTLFPPASRADLYPFPLFSRIRPWFSRIDLSAPDTTRFPKLRNAMNVSFQVELSPGQALVIPAGWWHDVVSLGDTYTCSVNRFFRVRPLSRLLGVNMGLPLYLALANKRFVLAIEQLLRRRRVGS